MQFKRAVLEAIARGDVTLAFRRWGRPTVKAGSRLKTSVGVVAIDQVVQCAEADVTDADAARAGFGSRFDLFRDLRAGRGREFYRVDLRHAGPDERRLRAEDKDPDRGEIESAIAELARIDAASRRGPWTAAVLKAVAAQPATPAAELARSLGREKLSFKADVRRLKALGLTESLPVGYRLSPRGRAIRDALG